MLTVSVVASLAIIIAAPGKRTSAPERAAFSPADHVFARDLTDTANDALRAANRSHTALALRERSVQRARLEALGALIPLRVARTVPTSPGKTLAAISQEQLLLGRIEAASGRNPAMRALARSLERIERSHLVP